MRDELMAKLQEIQRHHRQQNSLKGRAFECSRTLCLIDEAIALATQQPEAGEAVGMFVNAQHLQAYRDGIGGPFLQAGVESAERTVPLYAAPKAEAQEAWIPVSERVPDAYQRVDVWPDPRDDTYSFYAIHDGGTNGVKAGNWYFNGRDGYDSVIKVTHWRPLPTPPAALSAHRAEGGQS